MKRVKEIVYDVSEETIMLPIIQVEDAKIEFERRELIKICSRT